MEILMWVELPSAIHGKSVAQFEQLFDLKD